MANRNIATLFFILLLFSIRVDAAFGLLTAGDLEDELPGWGNSTICESKIVKLKKIKCVLVNGQFRLLDKNNSSDDHKKFSKKCIRTVWVFDSTVVLG